MHSDTVAVTIAILIGIIFFTVSIYIFKNLDSTCPSVILRNGWAVIQALGACMITAGISYFVCRVFGKCNTSTVHTDETYLSIFGVFFLFITVLCAVMLKKYNDLTASGQQTCDDRTKKLTIFITVISSLGIVFTASVLVKKNLSRI